MDDIHTPTVASGPTSRGHTNGVPKDQLSLRELMGEKDRIESELKALSAVLDSHGVNMNTGLTTFDGYPRADIDVAQIRTTRARIIYIRNDYKSVMEKIATALQSHFAENAQNRTNGTTTGAAATSASIANTPSVADADDIPFAKVNSVVSGSPADSAGLKAGDQVIRFGFVTWLNHDDLRKVSEVVSQNEGRPIAVALLRPSASSPSPERLQLILTPRRNWGGRGTLGCHLVRA